MKARINRQSLNQFWKILQQADISSQVAHGARRKWSCLDFCSATESVKIVLFKYLGVLVVRGRQWKKGPMLACSFLFLPVLIDSINNYPRWQRRQRWESG